MTLSASDFYRAYRPSECDLRVYLHHHGVAPAEPGEFEEVIRRLGERHEKAYLVTLANVIDLSEGAQAERERRALEEIGKNAPIIYQAPLAATIRLGQRELRVAGVPDFLVREGDGYVVRDVKMARRITEKDHPEIIWQVRFYGRLFEFATGRAPVRLEVLNGMREMVSVEPAAAGAMEAELSRLLSVVESAAAPYEPVGWTRCAGCGYHDPCWSEAEGRNDVALVPRVDKNLARALRDLGVISFDDLLKKFDEAQLAAFQRPWGSRMQRVGKAAGDILRSAQALQSKKPFAIAAPDLPGQANFVMFDLEGLPPHLDELEKIYLWGLRVYGEKPSGFMPATAGFGPDGDREGWESFLSNAAAILQEHGDIRFVHWSAYEKTKLGLYIERHGDKDGIGAAVRERLLDLLPIMQAAFALPLPSYSLKVVEEFVGFERTQAEYGGQWAMARYIEATETEDQAARDAVVAEILKYNEEDLAATWAVLSWLRNPPA